MPTGPSEALAGRDVTFVVTATNYGPRAATNVVLTDAVIAPLTFASIRQTSGPAFTCTSPAVGAQGTITCRIAALPRDDAGTFAVVLRVSPSVPHGSRVSNTARVTASTFDPAPANNVATVEASVRAQADLRVAVAGPVGVPAAARVPYTITVTNAGPADAVRVSLTDVVPPGTTFVSYAQTAGPAFACTTPGVGGSGAVTCSAPSLRVQESATFDLVLSVSPTATGSITNTAHVSTTTHDPAPGNDHASVSTPLTPGQADVAITTTAGPLREGAVVYTIVVTNHGPTVASNVVITDTLPAGSVLASATTTQGRCTGTSPVRCALGTLAPSVSATTAVVVTLADRRAPASNTATVAATNSDPDPANNTSTAAGTAPASIFIGRSAIVALFVIGLLGVGLVVLYRRPSLTGPALFLPGVFLMVTGDWPHTTLWPSREIVTPPCPAWPWLYLLLLGASFVVFWQQGVLRARRRAAADVMYVPLALLMATFLISVVFSQVPALSWWAFGCALAIAGFTVAVSWILEEGTLRDALPVVIAAATVFLAARILIWRFDEGLTTFPYQVRSTAWLGKNQISWVLNLLAPLLLARFLAARSMGATLLYGGAWLMGGAAIYLVFSSTGVVAFALTTLVLCALDRHDWRRWSVLLLVFVGLGFGLMAVSTKPSIRLVVSLLQPDRATSVVTRLVVWRQTIPMIVDHPILGIGLGTYDDVAYSQYQAISIDPWFFRRGWHAHNTHLHLLAETGLLGLLAWGVFWFTIVRRLLQRWRHAGRLGGLDASAALCVVLAFFVLSMTDAILMARVHASLRMNLTLALLLVYGLVTAASEPSAPSGPLRPTQAPGSVISSTSC